MCRICTEFNDLTIHTLKCDHFCANSYSKLKLFTQLVVFDCSDSDIQYIPHELTSLTDLECWFTDLLHLPDTLINLKYLDCDYSSIVHIPDTYIKLEHLNCFHTPLTTISKNFVKLEELNISSTYIKKIPSDLITLNNLTMQDTLVTELPNTLINLQYLSINQHMHISYNICSILAKLPDSMMHMSTEMIDYVNRNARIDIGLSKLSRAFRLRQREPVLWKIAEYYIKRKYAPENILRYIELEEFFV